MMVTDHLVLRPVAKRLNVSVDERISMDCRNIKLLDAIPVKSVANIAASRPACLVHIQTAQLQCALDLKPHTGNAKTP